MGLCLDPSNGLVLYVADKLNHLIRKVTFPETITSDCGQVTYVAGLAQVAGSADGTVSSARFLRPVGIGIDKYTGSIFIAEQDNYMIRMISGGKLTRDFLRFVIRRNL